MGCLVCGKELAYQTAYSDSECCLCHKKCQSNVKCGDGHFVCDQCHSLSANDLMEKLCIDSRSKDPMQPAISLMNSPRLQMHGPEHHFLVPGVLFSTYYNIRNNLEQKEIKMIYG